MVKRVDKITGSPEPTKSKKKDKLSAGVEEDEIAGRAEEGEIAGSASETELLADERKLLKAIKLQKYTTLSQYIHAYRKMILWYIHAEFNDHNTYMVVPDKDFSNRNIFLMGRSTTKRILEKWH